MEDFVFGKVSSRDDDDCNIALPSFSCVIGVHSLPLSCIAEVKTEDLEIIFKAQPKTRKSFFHFLTVLARRKEEGRRGGKRGSTDFCRIHFPQ